MTPIIINIDITVYTVNIDHTISILQYSNKKTSRIFIKILFTVITLLSYRSVYTGSYRIIYYYHSTKTIFIHSECDRLWAQMFFYFPESSSN